MTTRSGESPNLSIAAPRTVSVGVITMVARPIRRSRGVLLLTRDAPGCQAGSSHGLRSCTVITLGRSALYGTE